MDLDGFFNMNMVTPFTTEAVSILKMELENTSQKIAEYVEFYVDVCAKIVFANCKSVEPMKKYALAVTSQYVLEIQKQVTKHINELLIA